MACRRQGDTRQAGRHGAPSVTLNLSPVRIDRQGRSGVMHVAAFDRYNIIDAADLDAAVAKRFGAHSCGTIGACRRSRGFANFQPQQFLGP